jgi:hypothetical protein
VILQLRPRLNRFQPWQVRIEVGLFKPAITSTERHAEMVPRVWDCSTLLKAIPWLKGSQPAIVVERHHRKLSLKHSAISNRTIGKPVQWFDSSTSLGVKRKGSFSS